MEFDRKEQIFVVGAGVIGCSLSLELADRGWQVTLVERDTALRGSSWAAAGMLAVEDPHNPVELLELSRYSRGQYDRFLARIEALGKISVRYQTERVRQYLPGGGSELLEEHSLNPRELATALRAAVVNSSVKLLEGAAGVTVPEQAATVITAGSWSGSLAPLRVRPAKGQMLRVTVPAGAITEVHRSAGIYVVPRMHGEQAGTALVGATIEDVGFDTTVQEKDLVRVRERAAGLAPELAFLTTAPCVESWAGLRPSTPDGLPLLGAVGEPGKRMWAATGHYRNGILLAPGTAVLMADLIEGKKPQVALEAFAPERFA